MMQRSRISSIQEQTVPGHGAMTIRKFGIRQCRKLVRGTVLMKPLVKLTLEAVMQEHVVLMLLPYLQEPDLGGGKVLQRIHPSEHLLGHSLDGGEKAGAATTALWLVLEVGRAFSSQDNLVKVRPSKCGIRSSQELCLRVEKDYSTEKDQSTGRVEQTHLCQFSKRLSSKQHFSLNDEESDDWNALTMATIVSEVAEQVGFEGQVTEAVVCEGTSLKELAEHAEESTRVEDIDKVQLSMPLHDMTIVEIKWRRMRHGVGMRLEWVILIEMNDSQLEIRLVGVADAAYMLCDHLTFNNSHNPFLQCWRLLVRDILFDIILGVNADANVGIVSGSERKLPILMFVKDGGSLPIHGGDGLLKVYNVKCEHPGSVPRYDEFGGLYSTKFNIGGSGGTRIVLFQKSVGGVHNLVTWLLISMLKMWPNGGSNADLVLDNEFSLREILSVRKGSGAPIDEQDIAEVFDMKLLERPFKSCDLVEKGAVSEKKPFVDYRGRMIADYLLIVDDDECILVGTEPKGRDRESGFITFPGGMREKEDELAFNNELVRVGLKIKLTCLVKTMNTVVLEGENERVITTFYCTTKDNVEGAKYDHPNQLEHCRYVDARVLTCMRKAKRNVHVGADLLIDLPFSKYVDELKGRVLSGKPPLTTDTGPPNLPLELFAGSCEPVSQFIGDDGCFLRTFPEEADEDRVTGGLLSSKLSVIKVGDRTPDFEKFSEFYKSWNEIHDFGPAAFTVSADYGELEARLVPVKDDSSFEEVSMNNRMMCDGMPGAIRQVVDGSGNIEVEIYYYHGSRRSGDYEIVRGGSAKSSPHIQERFRVSTYIYKSMLGGSRRDGHPTTSLDIPFTSTRLSLPLMMANCVEEEVYASGKIVMSAAATIVKSNDMLVKMLKDVGMQSQDTQRMFIESTMFLIAALLKVKKIVYELSDKYASLDSGVGGYYAFNVKFDMETKFPLPTGYQTTLPTEERYPLHMMPMATTCFFDLEEYGVSVLMGEEWKYWYGRILDGYASSGEDASLYKSGLSSLLHSIKNYLSSVGGGTVPGAGKRARFFCLASL